MLRLKAVATFWRLVQFALQRPRGAEDCPTIARFMVAGLKTGYYIRIPFPRNRFAEEGLIVRKPDSSSARLRWVRENTKHRRTATRQQGFCSSSMKQIPLDFGKPRMPPENCRLEIIRKRSFLRAPTQSTEPK